LEGGIAKGLAKGLGTFLEPDHLLGLEIGWPWCQFWKFPGKNLLLPFKEGFLGKNSNGTISQGGIARRLYSWKEGPI